MKEIMWKLCYSTTLLAKAAMKETILLNIIKQLWSKQTEQIQNLQKKTKQIQQITVYRSDTLCNTVLISRHETKRTK